MGEEYPTATDFKRFDGMRKLLIQDLTRITADRNTKRSDWEADELRRFYNVACERAVMAGLRQPTWVEMERADRFAAGHVDWSSKLPLYVAEAMFGLRWML